MREGCGWLASVRDEIEAELVLQTRASIIDVKEPSNGALGMPSLDQLRAVLDTVTGHENKKMVSVALGDYRCGTSMQAHEALRACATLTGLDVVKVGLRLERNDNADADAEESFRQWARHACPKRWALVLFADDEGFVPHWSAVIKRASEHGCYACVIDTADKQSGARLPTLLSTSALRSIIATVRALGMVAILAGSLREQDIAVLRAMGADYLGFRGLLCAGGRAGRITSQGLQRVQACFHNRARATAGAQLSTWAESAKV